MTWLTCFADAFFLSLWPSLLWAAAIGFASAMPRWKGGILTLLLALLPIAAAAIYFGVSFASDESFLVAGVIPWNDAGGHFCQAAQMAARGMTHLGMNGRFLYPAYFSSLLNLSGLNLLWAEALGGFLFAGSLTIALRAVVRFIGAPGAMIVALVCGLFFRERCAGLIMTENLGILCGLLSLAAFLSATKKQSFPLLLLGIFMLALGLCARPGAMFVLPLMIFYAGWSAKTWGQAIILDKIKAKELPQKESHSVKNNSLTSCFMAAFIALCLIFVAFGSNTLLSRTLYEGKVITNGNFSFTLYGMLTGGKWSDCLEWSHYDSPLVMRESLKLIREKPELLVMGAARAYKVALYRRILFMFNHESRPATLLLILAAFGLVALWKVALLRPYALWLALMAAGILLSIPFVPPWDAAERPFAATVPFQALLAGIGFYVVVMWIKKSPINLTKPGVSFSVIPLWCLAVIVFFLTVPWPLLHKVNFIPAAESNNGSPVLLRSGSFATVTPANYESFCHHLIPFLDHYPAERDFFSKLPHQVILGIDWKSKNFDRCAILNGVSEMAAFKGWMIDQRLLMPTAIPQGK